MPGRGVAVDASTALKWIFEENGTAAALELLDEEVIHAPDFMLVEVANVLWSKVRRGVLTRLEADAAYEAIASAPVALTPLADLTSAARTLAFALDVTVYDAVYAALAQRFDCPLATADRTLAQAMNTSGLQGSALLIE